MRKRIDSPEAADCVNREAYGDGDRLFQLGRFREALRSFQTAREADPSDGDAHLAIGNCWDAIGKPKRAEAAFREALSCLPEGEKAGALFNLGNALYDQSLYVEAVEVYRQAPAQSFAFEAAQKNLGRALRRLRTES